MASTRRFFSSLASLLSPTSPLTPEGRARRRYNCEKQSEWDGRADTAIGLLMAHHEAWRPEPRRPVTVADFGAGNERLRSILDSRITDEVEYHPYDLHPQASTTQRLDVSQGLPNRSFDVAVCLGLLEYLPSIPALARDLQASCRSALISYVTSDSPVAIPYDDRLRHGWTTHLKAEEIERIFTEAGFCLQGRDNSDGAATTLWLWAAEAGQRVSETNRAAAERERGRVRQNAAVEQMNDSMARVRAEVTHQLGEPGSVDTTFDPSSLVRFSPDLPERLSPEERERLIARAKDLEPWLQGPFLLGGDLVVGGVWRIDSRWLALDRHVPDLNGKRVLDVGSNAGYDPFMFNLRGAAEVLACELFEFIEQARFLESLYKTGVDFQQIGWQELSPETYGSFDLVHCHGVLYHEVDPVALLKRLHEMTAPGGTLLFGSMMLADPSLADLSRFVPRAYFRDNTWWWVPGPIAVREMLDSVGFTVEEDFGFSDGPPGEFPTINGYFRARRPR